MRVGAAGPQFVVGRSTGDRLSPSVVYRDGNQQINEEQIVCIALEIIRVKMQTIFQKKLDAGWFVLMWRPMVMLTCS